MIVMRRAALLLLLVPALALAHQALQSSAPADGEVVEVVPATLRLTFYEPVRIDFTRIAVEGPEGPLILGDLHTAGGERNVLLVPVEAGWHAGAFTVRWTTVGADGHRTDGTLAFVVEEDAEGLPEPEPEPEVEAGDPVAAAPGHHDPRIFPETPAFGPESAGYAAIRGLLFVSMLALVGALALPLAILPVTARRGPELAAALRPGIERGAARLGMAAAAALLVAALARLWAQSASLFGPAEALQPARIGTTLALQPWATGWWLQVAAVVLAVAGFALAMRGARGGWALAGMGGVAAAVTPALSGHAVASPGMAWLAIPADALHVLAAGGWLGGLLALVVVGLPAARRLERERRGAAVSALVQGFSPVALGLAAVLVTTGLVAAWLHLGDVTALWNSAYGRTLLLKLGLVAGVVLAGAHNFLRVRPALGDETGTRRLRWSAAVELLLALLVIGVTAVLVAIPPPAR
jgi:copper transport protein